MWQKGRLTETQTQTQTDSSRKTWACFIDDRQLASSHPITPLWNNPPASHLVHADARVHERGPAGCGRLGVRLGPGPGHVFSIGRVPGGNTRFRLGCVVIIVVVFSRAANSATTALIVVVDNDGGNVCLVGGTAHGWHGGERCLSALASRVCRWTRGSWPAGGGRCSSGRGSVPGGLSGARGPIRGVRLGPDQQLHDVV